MTRRGTLRLGSLVGPEACLPWVLRDAISEPTLDEGPAVIEIVGIHIAAPCDLDDLHIDGTLRLVSCTFAEGLTLRRARLGSLHLVRCHLGLPTRAEQGVSLDLRELTARTEVGLQHTTLTGGLDLDNASIGANLRVEETRLGLQADPGEISLSARNLHCLGNVGIEGTASVTTGGLVFDFAHIGGGLAIEGGARVGADANGHSLSVDAASVEGHLGVQGRRTRCDGGLNLIGARCGSQVLVIDGADIGSSTDHESISGDGLEVRGDLTIEGPRTQLAGKVRIPGARIGGQLTIRASALVGADPADGCSVMADGARIASDLVIASPAPGHHRTTLAGALQLPGATIGGSFGIKPGATIGSNTFGNSIFADRVQVGGNVHLGVPSTGQNRGATRPMTVLEGALRVADAVVGGALQLLGGVDIGGNDRGDSLVASGARITRDLRLRGPGTVLHGSADLVGAVVGASLTIEGLVGTGSDEDVSILADGLQVSGSLYICDGAELAGGMVAKQATIEGDVTITGATIGKADAGKASLLLPGLRVGLDLDIGTEPPRQGEGTDRPGPTDVPRGIVIEEATIGGSLTIGPSAVLGLTPVGLALDASRATVGHMVRIDAEATTTGRLSLRAVHVAGAVVVGTAGTDGSGPDQPAVDLGEVEAGSVELGVGLTDRSVNLVGGRVRDQVSVQGHNRPNEHAWQPSGRSVLDLRRAVVGRLQLRGHRPVDRVDLSASTVHRLEDEPRFWTAGWLPPPKKGQPRKASTGDAVHWTRADLDGLTVTWMPTKATFAPPLRHAWLQFSVRETTPPPRHRLGGRLSRIKPGITSEPGALHSRPASRATYRMIAAAQAAAGEDDDARNTLVEMRRRHDPRWLRALRGLFGHGYRPGRALIGVLLFLGLAWGATMIAHAGGYMTTPGRKPETPVVSNACDEKPCLRPLAYAVDTVVPGTGIGEATRWQVSTDDGFWTWSVLLRYFLILFRLMGWAMWALFLVGAADMFLERRRTE